MIQLDHAHDWGTAPFPLGEVSADLAHGQFVGRIYKRRNRAGRVLNVYAVCRNASGRLLYPRKYCWHNGAFEVTGHQTDVPWGDREVVIDDLLDRPVKNGEVFWGVIKGPVVVEL